MILFIARVNPQVEGLRQSLLAACSVQESLDDDEMREYDPREHFETLGAGIPQHLGKYLRHLRRKNKHTQWHWHTIKMSIKKRSNIGLH